MATIVKYKRDNSKKSRIIVDMLRPGFNGMTTVPERVVLPRPIEAVNGACELMARRDRSRDDQVELASADFSDAYPHLCINQRELQHCLVVPPRRT
eukprot:3070763-Heterocapsa_arctica.AAC.1